jgi:sterol desaturase/sphingolipid hydroxylase (fatty acid hydroxylase superfamily)
MLDNNELVAAATPVFLLMIALEAWLSHRRRLDAYTLADSITSMSCGIWTVTLEVFTKSAMLLAYGWVFAHLSFWQSAPDSAWTWAWSFIAFDFVYYWAHRWSHEINFLWAVHSPHHQSEEFNLTTALRQGAFQDVFHAPLFMTLALLGCPPGVFIIQLTLSKFYQFWIHTRLVGRVPLIEGILNTPSAHRVHHAVNDVYLDRNYAATLMLWDRLFGTYIEEGEECVYGVRKGAPGWNAVWAQFAWPAVMWRDALRTARWRDKLSLWFRHTGWRPADVAAADPWPPFVLPSGRLYTATRTSTQGPRWTAAALSAFIAAVVLQNRLITHAAALALAPKLALVGAVTAALLLAAYCLQAVAPSGASAPARTPVS